MYVCVCRGVTNGDIRRAVEDGCESFHELQEDTGCAMQCGTCKQLAEVEFAMAQRGWQASTRRKVQITQKLPIIGHNTPKPGMAGT